VKIKMHRILIAMLLNALVTLMTATSASAVTLSDVIGGIDSTRVPAGLMSFSFEGDITYQTSGADKGTIPDHESFVAQ
jgi:hypothetical protein